MPVNRLALLSFLAIAPAAWAQAEQGRLENVIGLVQTRAAGDWALAGSGQAIRAGGALRTGSDSRAVASLAGSLVALDPGSHVDLVRLQQSPQVILPRGGLWLVVEAAPVQVATPRGVADILAPGRYLVEAGDAVQPTRVSVVSGEARLSNATGTVRAEAGQVAWVALDNVTRLGSVGSALGAVEWPSVPPVPVAVVAAETRAPAPVAVAPAPVAVAPATVAVAPEPAPALVAAAAAVPAVAMAAVAASQPEPEARSTAVTRATSTSRSAARVVPAAPPARSAPEPSRAATEQPRAAAQAQRPAAQPARTTTAQRAATPAPRPAAQPSRPAQRAAAQPARTPPRPAAQAAPRSQPGAADSAAAPAPARPLTAAGTPADRPS